jgi:hypothetical protein
MRSSAALLLLLAACASPKQPETPSTLQATLERAADLEGVPRALVLGLAYVDSRWAMTGRSIDGAYGLLHLVDRADAPRAQSLARAAQLTGLSEEALRTDAFANARGGAALLRAEADEFFSHALNLDESKLGDWYPVVMRASGVENARLADDYAAQVYRVLRDGAVSVTESGLVRLAPQAFIINGAIWADLEQDLGGEYCPNGACVAFVPAASSNYSNGRSGLPITTIVIHDMEGGYSGTISWFQNPSSQVSAHYDIRSSDGQITQQVHDGDTAWHAGNWDVNQHAIGIEHEGYAHTGSQWYTEAMYKSSAALTRWLCDTFHIPQDRTHIIGHYEVPDPNHAGWFGGAGSHHDPCDSWAGNPTWHNVSACYWDWNHYMALVTGGGPAATGTLTGFVGDACCGLGAGTRKPLPGAKVVLEGTAQEATTDATGTYSFTVAPGTYKPQASLAGYNTADHTSVGTGYSASISVTAGQTSWGSIIMTKTAPPPPPPPPPPPTVQAPVVTITAPKTGTSSITTPVQVVGTVDDKSVSTVKISGASVACSNGAFSGSAALVAGDNVITVTAANSGGTGTASVHVSYAPPQTGVQGHVTGPSGAIASAGVTLSPGAKHTATDATGHYLIDAAPGSYTVAVDANGFVAASQTVTLPGDRIATLDFALQVPAQPPAPHVRIDQPAAGATVTAGVVTVSGAAEVSGVRSVSVDNEAVDFDPVTGAFSVQVTLKPGVNTIVIDAVSADAQILESTVSVTYSDVSTSLAAAKTGCASAGLADLLALLPLAAFLRRRR